MITEKDLQEAIAECLGQRNPNANTCIKLAAYYTIKANLYGEPQDIFPMQSYADPAIVEYDSGTAFSNLIKGRSVDDVLPVIDELMTTVQVLQPKLYDAVIRKLS